MGEEIAASGYSSGGKVSILHLLSSARVPLAFRGPLFGLNRIHLNGEVRSLLDIPEDYDSSSHKQNNSYFRKQLDEQKG